MEVWKSLKVIMEVSRNSGRLTLSGLADLVRGLGGGAFTVVENGQAVGNRGRLDLEVLCQGKVTLSKEVGFLCVPRALS
jgi:ATP-dependent DNA helicase Q1